MIYKKVKVGKNRVGYRIVGQNGNVSKNVVPSHVLRALEPAPTGTTYDDAHEDNEPVLPDRHCVFCNQRGTRQKFVFGKVVYLCDEDYAIKTTGEVGQRVKENEHAQEEKAS